MGMQIQPPKPPPFPSTLPFENQIDRLFDRVAERLANSQATRFGNNIERNFPTVESIEWPTPLGVVKTPRLSMPSLTPPVLDERRKEIIKAAMGDDISGLVTMIPVIGFFASIIADAMEDTYAAKIDALLTPEERRAFMEYDKVSPITTIAALRAFIRER